MTSKSRTESEICRERNGQYGNGLDAMCVCGCRKGQHDAVKPWPMGERPEGYEGPLCEGFKKAKR